MATGKAITEDSIENPDPAESAFDVGDLPNAANRKNVRGDKKRDDAREQTLDHTVRTLLAIEPGRVFLSWLMHDICGLYGPGDNPSFNTEAVHYFMGLRQAAVVLHDRALRVAPVNYGTLLQEYAARINPK